MIIRSPHHPIRIAALTYLVLLAPPLRHILESSMTGQMLLQIPLLIGVGLLLRQALPARALSIVASCNYQGIAGLLLASVISAFWMLPLALDASVTEPFIAAAKYLSVPLLIGLPLALSWPRMGFIVRGVFLLELTASFFRLGWLYLIWPGRLCNNYLLDDQQRLGQYMLWIGGALLLGIAIKLIWGRFGSV
ncbi:hypothetical protein LSG25_09390 [Paralcaligenes sp. KSB-10]|jgi:hypothetical protein|uniref:hypothetical protein n=1 Tax=Paralcaligenes sp. KSB-10 TaxID=2901142 RepID=UPI001E61E612|nr:hypothetical protein [Paralcaligenes sp. KSB-10]UHL66048.1 hypothetical protein LSG25_09390 [Paralcaligenes sp. KSB-10]